MDSLLLYYWAIFLFALSSPWGRVSKYTHTHTHSQTPKGKFLLLALLSVCCQIIPLAMMGTAKVHEPCLVIKRKSGRRLFINLNSSGPSTKSQSLHNWITPKTSFMRSFTFKHVDVAVLIDFLQENMQKGTCMQEGEKYPWEIFPTNYFRQNSIKHKLFPETCCNFRKFFFPPRPLTLFFAPSSAHLSRHDKNWPLKCDYFLSSCRTTSRQLMD